MSRFLPIILSHITIIRGNLWLFKFRAIIWKGGFLNLCSKLTIHKVLIKLPNFSYHLFLSSKKNMSLFLLLFFREIEKIDMNSWKESCTSVLTINSPIMMSRFSQLPACPFFCPCLCPQFNNA